MTRRSADRWSRRGWMVLLGLAIASRAPHAARAETWWGDGFGDAAPHRRPMQLAVYALLYGSFTDVVLGPRHNVFGPGVGARFTLPLLHDGLLPRRNDSIELEAGADAYVGIPDAYHRDTFVGVVPDVSLRWTFYTGATSALYFKAGGQLDLGIHRPWWPGFAWPSGSVGVIFATGRNIDAKLELGWPAVRLGVAFEL